MSRSLLLLTLICGMSAFALAKELRLLVLIIASDQLPVYVEEQRLWRSYMHYDPGHVEAYFLKSNPELSTLTHIDGDIIWSKTDEGWVPASAGILNKTVYSLEAMRPRFHEFDFILRTNLSSFYHFPRLLQFLETLPKTKCYSGAPFTRSIASGAGFIISPDVAEAIIAHKHLILDNVKAQDDLIIGTLLSTLGVPLIMHKRLDILTLEDWDHMKDAISPMMFQFRLKNLDDSRRLTDELYVYSKLVEKFYEKE